MRPPTPLDPHERLLLFTWRIPRNTAAVVGSVPADDASLARLAALPGISGAFGLGTCQRRLFALLTDPAGGPAPADLPARLASALGPRANNLPPPEVFHGWDAVEHLCGVAAGLDAVVQGETEVGGQFRQAVRVAEENGHTGPELARILQRAVRVARNVRRTPGYGRLPSVLPLLEERVAAVATRAITEGRPFRAAVIGTGRMGRAAHRWLRAFTPEVVYVVSRDAGRAEDAATGSRGARPITLDMFRAEPPEVDLIITALPVEEPVLGPQHLSRAILPVLVCDLSLPRAVTVEVQTLPHVELVHIEDLADDREPHHAAHLALQVELADWRRRALVEAQQHRIDRLDKELRREMDDLLEHLAGDADQTKETRRRLARIRHIALERLADALASRPLPEETAPSMPTAPQETAV